MPDTPPADPDPGAGRPMAPAPGSAALARARLRASLVRALRPGEPALFTAIGLVIGIMATLLVLHHGGSEAPAPAADGPAVAATSTATATGASTAPSTVTSTVSATVPSARPAAGTGQPAAHAPAPPPAGIGSIPPVTKPDPAQIGLLHVRPVAVRIPAIEVSSPLVDLGLNPDGSLQVPTDFAKAGWYSGGPYPGDANGPPALIAGHIDDYHGPAIFYRLRELHPGDPVYVRRADGSTAAFVIYRTGDYLKSRFPTSSIYQPTHAPELRLITCTGQFDDHTRSYLSDFVAFARLADPGSHQ